MFHCSISTLYILSQFDHVITSFSIFNHAALQYLYTTYQFLCDQLLTSFCKHATLTFSTVYISLFNWWPHLSCMLPFCIWTHILVFLWSINHIIFQACFTLVFVCGHLIISFFKQVWYHYFNTTYQYFCHQLITSFYKLV